MHAIADDLPVDLSRLMFNLSLRQHLIILPMHFFRSGSWLPIIWLIVPEPHETRLPAGKPISRMIASACGIQSFQLSHELANLLITIQSLSA